MERLEVIFFWLAFLAYAVALVFFVYHLLTRRESQNRIGIVAAVAGWVCQLVWFVLRWAHAGHVPVYGAYESMTTIAWCVVTVYLVLEWRTKIKAVGLYVMPLILVFLGVAWASYSPPKSLVPALRSDITVIHVIGIFTSLAAFAVASGAAALYLYEDRALKKRHTGSVLGRLPSLQALDRLESHAIMFGLPFLTVGLVAGIVRASSFDVGRWYTDPLVLLAVVTWIVYAAFVCLRTMAGWRGRRTAYLALAGFVCILLIRFVVVPYLTHFHNWGG
jgi:cytochrome c-type biogenesis protein CcsB